MIITRSPLRISLGGGGTDLPSYYEHFGGMCIAAAIDKYVYITIHETFNPGLIIKYSKMERVERVKQIRHPIIREALRLVGIQECNLEIASIADIPAGTGLGSSGSFTTALLQGLHSYRKSFVQPDDIAAQACHIEIDILGDPVGKQDQYIAAYGGVSHFVFRPDNEVEVRPVRLSTETLYNLEDNLILFFTGQVRSASDILQDQDQRSKANNQQMLENLHKIKELGEMSLVALQMGDLHQFADLMNVHWEYKRERSASITNNQIDEWYALARDSGALGGKIIGAGGGGFLLFYAEDKTRLRAVMTQAGLREVRFRFEFDGVRTLVQ